MKSLPALKDKWELILQQRYPDLSSELIAAGVKKLEDIITNFINDGLADENFEEQLTSENDFRYQQRMSEALLYDRLKREGFKLSAPKKGGPDFKGIKNGITTWFELITPEPTSSILACNNNVAGRLKPCPEEANENYYDLLLKVTSSIQQKNQKFIGYRKSQTARKKGSLDKPPIVAENDICIIVINDGLLHPQDIACAGLNYELLHGTSGLPLILEAIYGIGYCYWDNKGSTPQLLRAQIEEINSKKNSPITVNHFLNDNMCNISSIMTLTLREDYGLADVIYKNHNTGLLAINENAQQKIPVGLLNCRIFSKQEAIALTQPTENKHHRYNVITSINGYRLSLHNDLQRFINTGILKFLTGKLKAHANYCPDMHISFSPTENNEGISITLSCNPTTPKETIDKILNEVSNDFSELHPFNNNFIEKLT